MKKEELATSLYQDIRNLQLVDFQSRMPQDKKGVEFTYNGKKYIAAIRKLTPLECGKLQGVPDWYRWDGIPESQQYKMLGNGWQCNTIQHCFSFLPKFGRPIKVLSLFDGMSCGNIVLQELGIPVEWYLASEIDKHAIKAEKNNFPNIVQLGSVTDINIKEIVARYGVPDLLVGGSPCTDMSFSGKMQGMVASSMEEIYTLNRYLELKGKGFKFEGQSYLFWEYMRILTELREYNENVLFFLENVEMLEKWERCISHAIGIRGVHINSALVSAQNRRRIYWSNIKVKDLGNTSLFDFSDDPFEWPTKQTDIPQPQDKGIFIKDVLQDIVPDKYYIKDETTSHLVENMDKKKLKDYFLQPQVEANEAFEYMSANSKYSRFTEKEKREISVLGYELEKLRLKRDYFMVGQDYEKEDHNEQVS